MILKRILIAGLALMICLALFASLENSTHPVNADLPYKQADVKRLSISSNVRNDINGTVEETVRELGFHIYQAQKIADLPLRVRLKQILKISLENLLLTLQDHAQTLFMRIASCFSTCMKKWTGFCGMGMAAFLLPSRKK